MPDNVTTVPGTTPIDWYLGNYAYSSIVSSMAALKFKLATDLNRIMYKNAAGTPYKIMVDGSTTSNIPQYSVLFADANGAAVSKTGFTFNNGSDLLSLPGNVEIAGTLLNIRNDNNGVTKGVCGNQEADTAANAAWEVQSSTSTGGVYQFGSSYTTQGEWTNKTVLYGTASIAIAGAGEVGIYAGGYNSGDKALTISTGRVCTFAVFPIAYTSFADPAGKPFES
jgi:hypothetical protein